MHTGDGPENQVTYAFSPSPCHVAFRPGGRNTGCHAARCSDPAGGRSARHDHSDRGSAAASRPSRCAMSDACSPASPASMLGGDWERGEWRRIARARVRSSGERPDRRAASRSRTPFANGCDRACGRGPRAPPGRASGRGLEEGPPRLRQGERHGKRGLNAYVEPRPGGLAAAEAEHPLEPQGARPVLLAGDPPDHPEPVGQRPVRVLEDRACDDGRLMPAGSAFEADPRHGPGLGVAAPRTAEGFRPSRGEQIPRQAASVGKRASSSASARG